MMRLGSITLCIFKEMVFLSHVPQYDNKYRPDGTFFMF